MNLTKTDVYNMVSSLSFPKDSYWIIMGAVLVMNSIKETTHDIDLGCTPTLFNTLLASGYSSKLSRSGRQKIDYSTNIHLYLDWPVISLETIDGIQVASLDSVIKDKLHFGRDKDLQDIQLIKTYLKRGK